MDEDSRSLHKLFIDVSTMLRNIATMMASAKTRCLQKTQGRHTDAPQQVLDSFTRNVWETEATARAVEPVVVKFYTPLFHGSFESPWGERATSYCSAALDLTKRVLQPAFPLCPMIEHGPINAEAWIKDFPRWRLALTEEIPAFVNDPERLTQWLKICCHEEISTALHRQAYPASIITPNFPCYFESEFEEQVERSLAEKRKKQDFHRAFIASIRDESLEPISNTDTIANEKHHAEHSVFGDEVSGWGEETSSNTTISHPFDEPESDDELISGAPAGGAWHSVNDVPDQKWHGPLTGTKKQLRRWITGHDGGAKPERVINSAVGRGDYWGRIELAGKFSVWFPNQTKFAEANSRRLKEKVQGTSTDS